MEQGPHKHVLIVEDAPDLQLLLGRLLTKEGYTVAKAGNGKEALDYLRSPSEMPALILLDVMMPVMDGVTFREEQRKDQRLSGIPVVVMTACTDLKDLALKMDVRNILKKPVSVDALLDAVESF